MDWPDVKAKVRLPSSDERQPVKNGASDITIAAAATDSDKGYSFTPSFSSSSSSSTSLENLHPTRLDSSVDRNQAAEGPLSAPALRRLHFDSDSLHQSTDDARLRYQQAKLVFHANSSESVGAGSFSASMDSVPSVSSARKAGPQPVVKLPQQSRATPHRMESSGKHSSASFVSQHIFQVASPEGTGINTRIPSSQNKPGYAYQHASPLPRNGARHPFNLPAPNSSDYFKHSHSRLRGNQDHVTRPAFSFSRRLEDDWTKWVELGLKISGLPPSTTTRDLYRCFSKEGNIVLIELYENTRSEREGTACVRFRYAFSFNFTLKTFRNLTLQQTSTHSAILGYRKIPDPYPKPRNCICTTVSGTS